ncbi:MAG: beta-galactosidase [Phycisphaerales bacterium]
MAALTYDGQSFMIDGRRIWLVAGSVEYTRCPREAWRERIAAARNAGLNTITTSVVWARHEGRAGQFDFTGDNDLRHFVNLVAEAGLYLVLRMGPYQGNGWDLGGLPAWLLGNANITLRTTNQPFLECCSRFIGAVARQVADLQATGGDADDAKKAGPIVLVQSESGWTCGHDQLAHGYLGELNRYLRESGFEVPFVNANNLWQGVEGEIDGWVGTGPLLANLRQLNMVRPSQPRFVAEYRLGSRATWGRPTAKPPRTDEVQRGLLEILAAGGQYSVEPFFGGTNFGFSAGRLGDGPDSFAITNDDRGAPLDEAGQPRETYHALRRVSMFASRFGRLLSHLDSKRHAVTLVPPRAGDGERRAKGGKAAAHVGYDGPVIVHASGSQGHVVFIFAPEPGVADHTRDAVDLLLPDGTTLPVFLGDQPVAWVLLDTRIVGRSQLDYCNLSCVAIAGRVLVICGPAGSDARLSINGAELQAHVPEGDEPLLIDHEGVILCLTPDTLLPQLHIGDDAVYMGIDGLTHDGQPIVPAWGAKYRKVHTEATWQTISAEEAPKVVVKIPPPPPVYVRGRRKLPPPPKIVKIKGKNTLVPPPEPTTQIVIGKPTGFVVPHTKPIGKVTIAHWLCAAQDAYIDGTGPRFASIAGPAELGKLGAASGYGWYRITLKNPSAGTVLLAAPHAGDRLAFFEDGKRIAHIGRGPGTEPTAKLRLHKGEQTLVVLAENLGRFAEGSQLGEFKGIFGHLWGVEPLRTSKGEVHEAEPIDVLGFKAPLWNVSPGDVTESRRLRWAVPGKHKGGLLIRLNPHGHRGLILLNAKPFRFFDPSGPDTLFIEPAQLSKGKNTLELALLGGGAAALRDLAEAVEFLDCEDNLTAKAEWSFAKWEQPAASAFHTEHKRGHEPRWWKATFPLAHAADLTLDTDGLSKGQAYVNGKHLGRYFTQTEAGQKVGPQTELFVPAAWLHAGKDNEVVIFDEHGFSPAKVRLSGIKA